MSEQSPTGEDQDKVKPRWALTVFGPPTDDGTRRIDSTRELDEECQEIRLIKLIRSNGRIITPDDYAGITDFWFSFSRRRGADYTVFEIACVYPKRFADLESVLSVSYKCMVNSNMLEIPYISNTGSGPSRNTRQYAECLSMLIGNCTAITRISVGLATKMISELSHDDADSICCKLVVDETINDLPPGIAYIINMHAGRVAEAIIADVSDDIV